MDTIALPEGPRVRSARPWVSCSWWRQGHAVVVVCGEVVSSRQVGTGAECPSRSRCCPPRRGSPVSSIGSVAYWSSPTRASGLWRGSLSQRLVGTLDVRPSDSEIDLLEGATRSSNQVSTLFTALSVMVGLLFAYNAMLSRFPLAGATSPACGHGRISPRAGGLLLSKFSWSEGCPSLSDSRSATSRSRAVFGPCHAISRQAFRSVPSGQSRPPHCSSRSAWASRDGHRCGCPAIGALRGRPSKPWRAPQRVVA